MYKIRINILLFRFSIILPLVLISFSCNKFVDVPPPNDQLVTENVFSGDESATSAVLGIYAKIMQSTNYIANGGMSVYGGLSADELLNTTNSSIYQPYQNNSITPTNANLAGNFWTPAYNYIYQSNSIIENLNKSVAISDSVKHLLLGEAKFFRAFFEFYMTNLFGPAPLPISSDYRINSVMSRSDTATVYNQILADLTDAQSLLSKDQPVGDKTRVNYWAVTALKARAYLYIGDWQNAESNAAQIINSPIFALEEINNVFLASSAESLFEISAATTSPTNTAEGQTFIPYSPSSIPSFVLTNSLLNSFEAGDLRKINWTKVNTVNGTDYTYPYKYKVRSGTAGAAKTENNIIFRLAEQYLIRAEARLNTGNTDGALSDLNMIRSRAGLPDLDPASSAADIATAIHQENRIEFFDEWGHRWLDMKRTGQTDAVMSIEKPAVWKSDARLFPIPQSEINSDPNLNQNPGY